MGKAGQAVDERRETGRPAVDTITRFPMQAAAGAVDNRVLVWTRGEFGNSRRPRTVTVLLVPAFAGRPHPARGRMVSEHVERPARAGASIAWQTGDVRAGAIVMRDPEGNEFCVT